jgi:hypothetical protein
MKKLYTEKTAKFRHICLIYRKNIKNSVYNFGDDQ